MSGQYRPSKEKNRSRFYILLSVIFVIAMVKWGLPMMIDIVSGPERKRTMINGNDIIPPQQPMISALADATNSAKLVLEGYTESEAEVELMLNDTSEAETTADENGFFRFDRAMLKVGINRIFVTAKDSMNNTSNSPVTVVTFDNKPVEMTLESPSNGIEIFGKSNQTIEVKGSVNKKNCEITVNNSLALVDNNGNFSHKMLLGEGDNKISIVAVDEAGNKDEAELNIIFHQ